jgi:hypothetical protein
MIYLLRHAHAGNKRTWPGPDDRRPLSATWLLRLSGGRVAEAAYLPPPGAPRSP